MNRIARISIVKDKRQYVLKNSLVPKISKMTLSFVEIAIKQPNVLQKDINRDGEEIMV